MQTDILIIDDEDVVVSVFTEILSTEGYRVIQAGTGREGLAIARQRPFPVILVDKNLPDISGIDVLQRVKELSPSTEVIIITAYGSMESAIQAIELGAYDYILKPFGDLTDIRKKIDRAAEKHRITGENTRLLTELQEKNRILEETVAALQGTQRVLMDMTARIAHEVRNPLISISTIAYLLNEDIHNDAPARREVKKIISEARRMDRILSEILEFSRPRTPSLKQHDIRNIIGDSIKSVKRSCQVKGIHIASDIPHDLPSLLLDRDQMIQVFVNIFRNSLDAMDKGGTLQIRASLDPEAVQVDIADDGKGIDPGILDKLFTPFFSTKVRGTGLGLSISRKIVEAHGGSLQIANRPEKGAHVTIRVPVNPVRKNLGGA